MTQQLRSGHWARLAKLHGAEAAARQAGACWQVGWMGRCRAEGSRRAHSTSAERLCEPWRKCARSGETSGEQWSPRGNAATGDPP
eukprot:6214075-Pleurochrysis_carterae.AAC.1